MKEKNKILISDYKIPAILGGRPTFDKPIPITEPTIPNRLEKIKNNFIQVLKSRMITNSKFVKDFELKIARYLSVKHAIALNSCTSGLMLILKALELKGEVIIPSFTFHATAHAVVWNGLRPVFVDSDLETYNIDPKEVEKAITPNTSAILAVYIFGNPPNMGALENIAKRYKLRLVFDAAHGMGTKYKEKSAGGFGDAESFSLSPTKLLTTGEGGVVTTNDDEIARRVRVGRNYGDPGTYDCEFSGLSARMDEFSALLGLESLKEVEKNVVRRNKMIALYKKLLSNIPGISFQKISRLDRSNYKDLSIFIDKERFGLDRDSLYKALIAENISVRKYFSPPIHKQKAFFRYSLELDGKLRNTNILSDNLLSLPLFSHIEEKNIYKICCAIKRIFSYRIQIKKAL